MRLPILFKVGLGLVMGSWALDVFSNSMLATSFYRAAIASFHLTAFSAAMYTWIPVLVCMGVGFIASSILCALAELIISSVYGFIKALLPLLGNVLNGAIYLGHDLYRLPRSERKERLREACQWSFISFFENVVEPVAKKIHSLTAWCITALILALFVERYCPSLKNRLSWLQIDTWFMGSGPQAALDLHAVLSRLLTALFGW